MKNLFREVNELFDKLTSDVLPEEKTKLVFIDLPALFSQLRQKEKEAIVGWQLHSTLMAAINHENNTLLKGLASFLKLYDAQFLAETGINEDRIFELYRSGIIAWFHFQSVREGLLSLFEAPHPDLGHTVAYLDRDVRKRYPEFSGLINVIIEDVDRQWRYRRY